MVDLIEFLFLCAVVTLKPKFTQKKKKHTQEKLLSIKGVRLCLLFASHYLIHRRHTTASMNETGSINGR